MQPGQITYTASWTPEDNEVTLVIDRYAGVCGPGGSWPASSREEAAAVLFAEGYLTGGDWRESARGDHWVALAPMR